MKLKNKYIVSMAIAGLIILLFGSLRKITHQPSATSLLNVAYYILIGAGVLFLIKVLLNKDKNNFLNK